MRMKKQSTTVLSFDADHAAPCSRHYRYEEQNDLEDQVDPLNRAGSNTQDSGLLNFCRELSVILIKKYLVGDDPAEVRQEVIFELIARLHCTRAQANHLVDLALEILHVQVHGRYRRSEVELTYLIAKTTGAVRDVSLN